MVYSVYENGGDTPSCKAGRIVGLARTGIAACDTAMNIDLLDRDGLQAVFEAIALLGNELAGHLMDLDATPKAATLKAGVERVA